MINIVLASMAVLASVKADPAWFLGGAPFLSTPYTSAALVASAAASVVSPVAPVAPVASVASVAPVASVSAVPYTSVSQYNYAYGSSLSYSDYLPVVNSAYSLPYTLPYAYAASRDWFYRN